MSKNYDWIAPVAVIATVAIVAGKLGNLNLFGGVKAADQKYVKDTTDQHKDVVKDLQINQGKLKYDRNTYRLIAQKQFDAMNRIGTDETLLFNSLKNLLPDDLKTVYMDFGLRASTVAGIGISGRKNLIQWYQSELSGDTLDEMEAIWQPTGLVK